MRGRPLVELDQLVYLRPGQAPAPADEIIQPLPFGLMRHGESFYVHGLETNASGAVSLRGAMEDVVTGEAVVIDVPCARFPSRMVAIAIDIAVQLVLFAVLAVLIGATQASGGLDAAAAAAIALSATVLILVGYPTIFETLSRGRSLGKLAMGLRVVGDDGGPERFRQALVRALASVFEIWLLLGAPALITSLLSARGKRLGDLFAGTFVIQERLRAQPGAPVMMPAALALWAASLELSGLPDETAAIARSYLSRFWELAPAAREEFGRRIAAQVAARVSPPPPPGTPPAAYLSAVLAERRAREMARMAARAGQDGSVPGGYAQGGTAPGGYAQGGYGQPGWGPAATAPGSATPAPGTPERAEPAGQPPPADSGSDGRPDGDPAPPERRPASGFTPPA
jgi:uncharacterized RDD family membrane protein YckC